MFSFPNNARVGRSQRMARAILGSMKPGLVDKAFQRGFTLIEVVVVVGIVAILAAVTFVNMSASSQKSRDAKRQADLQTMQTAIELYKNKYGRYPAQCASGAASNGWSGQLGTSYACTDGSTQYIVGLAPEFIPVLPKDPKLNGTASGYAYRTNANGTVYKLMARSTVESETVTYSHPFSSCDVDPINNATSDIRLGGWCIGVSYNSFNTPTQCLDTNVIFQKSYGVWGGFAPLRAPANTSLKDPLAAIPADGNKMTAVTDTALVICQ